MTTPKVAARYLVFAYIGSIVALPIAGLFWYAFSDGVMVFWEAMIDPEAVHAFRLTFVAAIAIAIFNAIFGTAAAYALTKYKFSGARFLDSLVDLPFAIPTAVTGLVLAVMLGPDAPIGAFFASRGISLLYSTPAVYIAFIVVTLPFVIRAVQPLLLAVDPAEEEAAVTLGATPLQIFFAIELPVIRPGIIAGSALAFARALGEFGVVVFIAGTEPFRTQVAATYVFSRIEHFDFRGASVAAVIVLVISSLLLWTVRRIEQHIS